MRNSIRSLILFVPMLVALNAQAQTEPKQSTDTAGSITGRVTLGGKPAQGVKVIAFKRESSSTQEPAASAKTDQYGHFQLSKLPSDHYYVVPHAPAYIASEQVEPGRPGKAISLAEGETIEGLDFALIRGGVITGRITDEEGQPVMGEMVSLFQLDSKGQKQEVFYFTLLPQYYFGTDDQGVYRIFGLPPGRYLVSVGQETERGGMGGLRYHPLTFYPGTGDESKAGLVELSAGKEATGIDITLGRRLKAYSASGRVIDATTGKPLPNAQLKVGMIHDGGSSGLNGLSSDARGNFRLDGLLPGRFYVTTTLEAKSGLYSSVASFQIKDRDITGLEVKIARGSSISGVLAVEGASDPELIKRLSRIQLWASVSSPDIIQGADETARISAVNPDGSFHIAGLHPGKVFLHIARNSDSKGFAILRVERGGIESSNEIEVGSGEQVAGVRVILGYASGRIRGQVKVEGGKLPTDAEIHIGVRLVDGPATQSVPHVEVDPNGRFVVEDLITGEYDISVYVLSPMPPTGGTTRSLTQSVTKRVTVTSGAEAEVVLVVELIAKGKDQ